MKTSRFRRFAASSLAIVALAAAPVAAQAVSQRGFADVRGFWFPQDAPNDPANGVVDLLVREEVFAKPSSWLRLSGGVELRANSHDQVDARWRVDFRDRGLLRPAISVRRLAATVSRGPLTVDAGKQFIRWGKTDIVTPTDRFAPRDFLTVVDNEFLGVTAARLNYEKGPNTIEAVWAPRFTPSRIPLIDQRWAPMELPNSVRLGEV